MKQKYFLNRFFVALLLLTLLQSVSLSLASDSKNAADDTRIKEAGRLAHVACLYNMKIVTLENTNSKPRASDTHQVQSKESKWYLWRDDNQVEIQSVSQKPVGERWKRLKSGDIEFTSLYHDKKFAIQYPPSDLKALEQHPDWMTKTMLVSQKLLQRLEKTGEIRVLGYEAEQYTGTIGDIDLKIIWLPSLMLPALIQQRDHQQLMEVKLLEVHPWSSAPWYPILSVDYTDMEFADIGDNEAHPVVKLHLQGSSLSAIQYPHRH